MLWFKSFDKDRANEAKRYYKSEDYRRRVSALLAYLNENASTLKGKRIAFGSGILMSNYSQRLRLDEQIKGYTRRPFSQELIQWLKDHSEELIIWTSSTREAVISKLASADLDVEGIRIVDHREYLEAGGINRLETFDATKVPFEQLKRYRNTINHIKLPSVLGIDHLIDNPLHKALAVGCGENINPYIPIKSFQPMNAEDFANDNELFRALETIVQAGRTVIPFH